MKKRPRKRAAPFLCTLAGTYFVVLTARIVVTSAFAVGTAENAVSAAEYKQDDDDKNAAAVRTAENAVTTTITVSATNYAAVSATTEQ